jgi:Ca2+-binding EF-hand superfamily protein
VTVRDHPNQNIIRNQNMKITAVLFALIVTASVSFAADEKKPAEGAKPAEAAKPKQDPAAVFAKKDKDGNGKVTKEEFLDKAKDAAKAEKQFAAKDKDKDGSLTKEEFTAAGGKKKEAK